MLQEHGKKQRKKKVNYTKFNYSKYPISFSYKRNKFFIIGDSHLSRTDKKNLRRMLLMRMYILNVLVEQTDYYVVPTLGDENHDSVIIHIGSDDTKKSDYNNVNVEDLVKTNYKYWRKM